VKNPTFTLQADDEIDVVLFAGAGGSDEGIEAATGRPAAIAINHSDDAISMNRVNHPTTETFVTDVFDVDPIMAVRGRRVGILHASPDCTHHSQAKGGQPRDKKLRSLAWVIHRWAGKVRPALITTENVVQLEDWGRLIAKRCPQTGRVVKLDRSVAKPGERVPVREQFLVPDPKCKGKTFMAFIRGLREMGYEVQWWRLLAADYGVGQTRERLFIVARCDGEPIVKPVPSHSQNGTNGTKPWVAAADSIEWEHKCRSIFGRKKDLAKATHRRIAKGISKFVLNSTNPFIVPASRISGDHESQRTLIAPTVAPLTHQGGDRVYSLQQPLATVTGANRGELALIAPTLVHSGFSRGQEAHTGQPVPRRAPPEPRRNLVAAHLAQANGGKNTTPGHHPRRPFSTITAKGCQQQLVAAHLAHLRNHCDARDVTEPLRTLSAGGEHHGLVTATLVTNTTGHGPTDLGAPAPTLTTGSQQMLMTTELDGGCELTQEQVDSALRVARFLVANLDEDRGEMTDQDLLKLVTVTIEGCDYVIVDIGLRMLRPRELYSASSFRKSFIIDRGHDGRQFTKTKQIKFVGNAVPPLLQQAVIEANWRRRPQQALRLAA
jgi:DNA (cytosine-5)-methyltransferase 1